MIAMFYRRGVYSNDACKVTVACSGSSDAYISLTTVGADGETISLRCAPNSEVYHTLKKGTVIHCKATSRMPNSSYIYLNDSMVASGSGGATYDYAVVSNATIDAYGYQGGSRITITEES